MHRSLGRAATYDVFSNGPLTMGSQTMTGRAASAGDMSLASMEIGSGTTGGYDLVSGGRIIGNGGVTVRGDARHRDGISGVNFVGGSASQGPPGIDFAREYNDLAALSDSLAARATTPGAAYTEQPWALQLQGATGETVSVLNVDAAVLARAPRFQIAAPAGSTLVVNVRMTTSGPLRVSMDAMDLSGISASGILWNLVGVTTFTVTGSINWKGTLLAPQTDVVKTGNNQDWTGQVIAKSGSISGLHLINTPFTGCAPPPDVEPEPGPDLKVAAICVDRGSSPANLIVRLRNLETSAVTGIAWEDEDSGEAGVIAVVAGSSDYYFQVHGAAGHTITVKKGSTEVSTIPPTSSTCERTISTTKQTVGPAPPGTWPIAVYGPNDELVVCEDVAAGASFSVTVPGSFTVGVSVPIGEAPGGVAYSVRELAERGGTSTVSRYPITVTDGPPAIPVTVTNTFGNAPVNPLQPTCADPNPEPTPEPTPVPTPEPTPVPTPEPTPEPTPVPLPDPGPEQPTVPDGAPDPPPGPDLVPAQPGVPAADLVVTHTVSPRRILLGQTVETVTRVRNAGTVAAVGVVARELPQYRNRIAARVARVLSVSATAGGCHTPRPVQCELGTLQPGRTVVIRSRARPLVAGPLQTVVFASSETPERNTTNNLAGSWLGVRRRSSPLRVQVNAPPAGRVGTALSYRVSVEATRRVGTRAVRLCTRIPASFTSASAPGTFANRGLRCRDFAEVSGAPRGFTVRAVPAAGGRIGLPGLAIASDRAAAARDRAEVQVAAGACAAALRRARC